MDIWTIAIICGIGYLVLSFLGTKIGDLKMPDIPFLNDNNQNETEQTQEESNPLPEPIQKGVDELSKDYTLPLWLLVLVFIILYIIMKR